MQNPIISAVGGNALAAILPRPALYAAAAVGGWLLFRSMWRKRR